MRIFKSAAFKQLDSSVAREMASGYVQWFEHNGEQVSHLGMANFLGGFLGCATAQALTYGGLKPEEQPALRATYDVVSTMMAVEARAKGPIVKLGEFDDIVGMAQGRMFGLGMNAEHFITTFLDRPKKQLGATPEMMLAPLVYGVKWIKVTWPGGPPFERPQNKNDG